MKGFLDELNIQRVGRAQKSISIKNFINRELRDQFNDKDEFAVVWYDKDFITKAHNDNKTYINVVFLNLNKSFYFKYDNENKEWEDSDSLVKVAIPIDFIHKLPIGSIWKKYRFTDRFDFKEYEISINPTNENSYFYQSIAQSIYFNYNQSEHKEFLPFDYKKYLRILSKDTTPLINIKKEDINYVIHPVSLFIAHYGYHMDIKRIISTFSWTTVKRMLCLETVVPQFESDDNISRYIVLPRKFSHKDAVFLYHLKYDKYCRSKVKSLVGTINLSKEDGRNVEVGFWHNLETKLKIKGIRIGNSILCASIIGISEPQGEEINVAIRSPTNVNADRNDGTAPQEFTSYQTYISDGEIEDLDITRNPVNNLAIVDLKEKLEVLGKRRAINKIKVDDEVDKNNATLISQEEVTEFSVGDLQGHGGTGLINCFYDTDDTEKPLQNSQFNKLWEHATRLRGTISAQVEWFTFKKGFNTSDDFIRISLNSIHELYPNVAKPKNLLLIRVVLSSTNYYILEFGQGCSGLVYKESAGQNFIYDHNDGLVDLLCKCVMVEGVFDYNFTNIFDGKLVSFRHRTTEHNTNNWILNGINKLITLD